MLEFILTDHEVRDIGNLVYSISGTYKCIDSPDFLLAVTPLAHQLPRRLRDTLNGFRLQDDGCGVLCIRGYSVNFEKAGPTPRTWDTKEDNERTLTEEIFLALCGCLLGDLVSWSSEQDGHLVHNVLPIAEHEKSQLGWGSDIEFILHVEDAFSQFSPDYLGLFCVRNPGMTGTTVSSVSDLKLDELDVSTLMGDNYFVRPDDAHLEVSAERKTSAVGGNVALKNRQVEIDNQARVAILFGDPETPYIRLDPPYMSPADSLAQSALEKLLLDLNTNKRTCRLAAGDIVFIDNFRAVHGREPFKARYDGTDRWLKRIKVARDLRKSRRARSSATARQIE